MVAAVPDGRLVWVVNRDTNRGVSVRVGTDQALGVNNPAW